MAKHKSAIELEQNLSLLAQNFFRELRKIAEQRLKLERGTISSIRSDLITKGGIERKVKAVKSVIPKTFTVRLESSLGEKLAKSRGTADELEDKLQETGLAFEDKVKTVGRMKEELDRREGVLVQSVQEIETYIRAVFYLKQEADDMYVQLKDTSKLQKKSLKELEKNLSAIEGRRDCVLKAINAFQPSKLLLENMVSDLPKYSTTQDLVEYYLVLMRLQKELLDQEAECSEAQERLINDRQRVEQYRRHIPTIVVSKESAIVDLKSKVKDLKNETTLLEQQIDSTIASRVRDDVIWFDIQRWIKKLFLASIEIRPPGPEEPTSGTLDMLERIKDFVKDAFEITDRLKTTGDG